MLNKDKFSQYFSAIALAGGLILVAYQIGQATDLTAIQVQAEHTSRWRQVDATRQSETFAIVLAKSIEHPRELTLAELIELDAYYMGVLDQLNSKERELSAGYASSSETFAQYVEQAARTYFGNPFAKAWWRQYRKTYVGRRGTNFMTMTDAAIRAVSSSGAEDTFAAIRLELISEGPG